MDVEFVERDLGQVFEVGLHLPGLGVRAEGPDQLRVHPEPVGDEEQPILVAGLRFADVDRPGQGSVEGDRVDRDRPDLRVVGTVRRPLGAEVRLGVGAGSLAVGGVRVDRQAFGQGDDRCPELRRRRRAVERLWIGEADVEARG